jgi:hypothetical protein
MKGPHKAGQSIEAIQENWLRGSATTFAEQFFIIKAQCVLANETGTPLSDVSCAAHFRTRRGAYTMSAKCRLRSGASVAHLV